MRSYEVRLIAALGLGERGTGMAKLNPFEFAQEVRQEVAKVTWPAWKEVWITSVMVLIMIVAASIFFLVADQILGALVNQILQLGR